MLEPWTLVIVKWLKIEFLAITKEYIVGWVLDDSPDLLTLTVTCNDNEDYYSVDLPRNQITDVTVIQSSEEFECLRQS